MRRTSLFGGMLAASMVFLAGTGLPQSNLQPMSEISGRREKYSTPARKGQHKLRKARLSGPSDRWLNQRQRRKLERQTRRRSKRHAHK